MVSKRKESGDARSKHHQGTTDEPLCRKLRFLVRLVFDRRHLDARRYEHAARLPLGGVGA
jgi:hypothetical protein